MPHDIFMLAYGEPNAEENWARLKAVVPKHLPAPRLIEGVDGMLAAFVNCAKASTTPWCFIVDADNWVRDGFDFEVPFEPAYDEVATWGATNAFNRLYYGHGGIKLFPTALLLAPHPEADPLDFAMTLSPRKRAVEVKASEHRFNTTPYRTWSTVFRECAKLTATAAAEPPKRRRAMQIWLERWNDPDAKAPFAEWCRRGAVEGRAYGELFRDEPARLTRIHDARWMRLAFDRHTPDAVEQPRPKPAPARHPPATHDVFMVAYGEPNAAENWARLKTVFPKARLVENIPGLFAGYAACARQARTPHFFAVDADNWIRDGFDFAVDFEPQSDELALWYAANPVNGLEYGHGAIKLFPTALVNAAAAGHVDKVDFSTSLGRNRYTEICASEHRFNGDPYSTWAGAFRECAKLTSAATRGGFKSRGLAKFRLEAWCNRTIKGAKFADWCIKGARDGREFVRTEAKDFEALRKINDFAWLKARFRARHVRKVEIPPRS